MNYIFVIIPLVIQKLLWPFFRIFFIIFCDLKINGLENLKKIDKKYKVLFAANHTSELDPIVPVTCLPFFSRFSPLFCVTKGKSFYDESGFRQIFYGGLLFKMVGGQEAYSGNKDYEKSLINHIKLLNMGYSDLIYPEGGITKTGLLGEAKGGVSYLSEKTGAVIVPVGISGLFKISFLDIILRRRKLIVAFGSAISQEDIKKNVPKTLDDYNHYKVEAQYVMNEISKLIV